MAHPKLWIGTSGWVYKHWMGIFYPDKMAGSEQLAFYAQHFSTVEINYSYYRLPEKSSFENWNYETPAGFLFAVKASRYLTHMKKLKDPKEPLSRLMNRAVGLENKLGPILFQFPRTWQVDLERLESFTEALKSYHRCRWAFEFRHESWLCPETYRLLEKVGAALCIPIHPDMPREEILTVPWSYLRFHTGQDGIGFSDGELKEWAKRIKEFMRKDADVYAYFNNDPQGHALRDAEKLRGMLGQDFEPSPS
ncbi:MAG TPA: DUF72 domain-containing protein [Capsulimonadaceae bacterium]|nr:DUF72 domain-containing protein [Capsulimonadaceae bacterium]